MKKDKLSLPAVLLILSIPLIYLAFIYKSLPPIVAVHFGIDGKPDRFGSKTEFIGSVLFMLIAAAGSYFLVANIHKIDPKKSAKLSAGSMKKIALAVVVLFFCVKYCYHLFYH